MTILGKANLIICLRINSDGKGVTAEQLYKLVAREQIYFDATRVERCKCDALKGIRKAFCEINGVPLSIKECSFKGRCVGTCPKCEEKLNYINSWRKEHNA